MSHILYMPSYFLPQNNELFAVSIFLFWIFWRNQLKKKNRKTMVIWKLEGILWIRSRENIETTTKKSTSQFHAIDKIRIQSGPSSIFFYLEEIRQTFRRTTRQQIYFSKEKEEVVSCTHIVLSILNWNKIPTKLFSIFSHPYMRKSRKSH